jgi:hypothetical protein
MWAMITVYPYCTIPTKRCQLLKMLLNTFSHCKPSGQSKYKTILPMTKAGNYMQLSYITRKNQANKFYQEKMDSYGTY